MPVQQIPSLSNIAMNIPSRLLYNKNITPQIQADRVATRIPSTISQITQNSNLAIFDIPNSALMDFTRAVLGFNVALTGTATVRASNNIGTMIQRVRVLMDSEVIEDLNI